MTRILVAVAIFSFIPSFANFRLNEPLVGGEIDWAKFLSICNFTIIATIISLISSFLSIHLLSDFQYGQLGLFNWIRQKCAPWHTNFVFQFVHWASFLLIPVQCMAKPNFQCQIAPFYSHTHTHAEQKFMDDLQSLFGGRSQ